MHQIAYENIRDVHVEEKEAGGFTLRRGRNPRLPPAGAHEGQAHRRPAQDRCVSGLGDVEEVANQLRQRLRHMEDREAMHSAPRRRRAGHAPRTDTPTGGDDELRRALNKLRAGALAPDVPKAVKLRDET